LHVIGPANSPALDGVDVDRHHAKPFSAFRDEPAEEIASRSATDLTAHDYTIVVDESLLDLELHVGDRGFEAGDDLNRLLLVPTVSGPIAGARRVLWCHNAVMHPGNALTVRETEQRIPHV